MQDLELESLCNGVGHSQMVKDHPFANDSGSRDCVKLPSLTAVSRIIEAGRILMAHSSPNLRVRKCKMMQDFDAQSFILSAYFQF